ncbi:hypothetical protein diail_2610 [Diaporthe ilicicola]|nr:hypothetical protein diail_2610 [Diaporthe ilicicola]
MSGPHNASQPGHDAQETMDTEGYDMQIALDQLAAGSTEALKIHLARQAGLDPDTVSIRSTPFHASGHEPNGKFSYIGRVDNILPPGETQELAADGTKAVPRVILEDTEVPYQYAPLDTERRQFRLLKLAPPGDGGITTSFRLETFSLDDAPPYFCLSYVWGDPDRFLRINCGGRMVPVTQNLFHALRTCLSRYPDTWLWADGICINQEDLAERSSQVLFMGTIYEKAVMVLAHPGHYMYGPVEKEETSDVGNTALEDQIEGLGFQDVSNSGVEDGPEDLSPKLDKPIGVAGFEPISVDSAFSSKNIQSAISIMTLLTRALSDKILSDKDWERIRLPNPDTQEGREIWGNLMNFWTQDWYFRTWILQEVILAKKVVILFQEAAISLEAITDFWSLPQQHVLPPTLRIGPYADIFNMVRHLSPVSSFKRLRERRQKVEHVDKNEDGSDRASASPSLFELLCLSRNNLATDPRDKIYGLLGLTDDAVSRSIIPDYSPENTTSKLFTQVASELISAGQIEDILNHAGVDQNISDLPSWVPDWTKQSRSTLPSHLYQCMGKTTSTASVSEGDGKPKLVMRGAIISRVNQVGAAWKFYCHDRSAMPFGRFATAPGREIPPFNDEDARNFVMTFASNFKEDLSERYVGEGFEDALVRTLAVDCSWQGQRIGPRPKPADGTAVIIASEKPRDVDQPALSTSDEFFDGVESFKGFYARGPNSEEDLAAPGIRVHQTAIFMWLLDFDEEVEAELQTRMVTFTMPFQEAQRGRRIAALGTREPVKPDDTTGGADNDTEKRRKKTRYATESLETHLMGTLPWDAEIENYIVLFEGCRTPFVVRELEEGNNNEEGAEFQIIGDCYVHGVMDGELLCFVDDLDEKLEPEYVSMDANGRQYAIRAPQGYVRFRDFTLVIIEALKTATRNHILPRSIGLIRARCPFVYGPTMLDALPDDVLLLIIVHLETAKDVRALLLANRRLRALIHTDHDGGWRAFVRSRFPSVPIPFAPSSSSSRYPGWGEIAKSLTWQSRAWDRRSLSFRAMLQVATRGQSSAPRRRQGTPYHPVLDAHFDVGTREELVVWGAGEDFIARRRRLGPDSIYPEKVVWHRLDGKDLNYSAGRDDIRAVSVVEGVGETADSLGALVGRDNGHLVLLDLSEERFGEKLADFSPEHTVVDETRDLGPTTKFNQGTINSIDVLPRKRLFAAATKAGVQLYNMPEQPGVNVAPSAYLDLTTHHFDQPNTTLGYARWMGEETMAFALQGCQHQLRYATITPTGIQTLTPYKNAALEEQFDISYGKGRLCTHSLTPLEPSSAAGGNASLLLTAWRDGSVRLQDVRTPSPFDLVYCDNIDPWSEFETLLPFGTTHFVGGGAHGATIKIFDFRWSRDYYHTAAMPCSPEQPFPKPNQPFLPAPGPTARPRSRCEPRPSGSRCSWHELSRDLYYRPNGKFFFSKSLPRENAYAGVWSMARSSSLAPNFYIGISGGVVEASLSSTPAALGDAMEVDPVFGCCTTGQRDLGAGYSTVPLEASLMETGDGLMYKENDRTVRMPPMRGRGWNKLRKDEYEGIPVERRGRHRLDERYQIMSDFINDVGWGRAKQRW